MLSVCERKGFAVLLRAVRARGSKTLVVNAHVP
jgi:hypothetical protein